MLLEPVLWLTGDEKNLVCVGCSCEVVVVVVRCNCEFVKVDVCVWERKRKRKGEREDVEAFCIFEEDHRNP